MLAKWQAEWESSQTESEQMRFAWSEQATPCLTNGPVYMTNVMCSLDTNYGWTVAFTIQGGTNGVPYDIFSTTNLTGGHVTNSFWVWQDVGYTCNRYFFTNQPDAQTFYILTTPGADLDGDGLYDGWEWKYFGTLAQTAEGDFDGDGWTNLQEYQNGTDPTVIDQPFKVFITRPKNNSVVP